MNDNEDLEQLVVLLDNVLASDNPAVKDALKKLLFITALVSDSDDQLGSRVNGLLSSTLRKVNALEKIVTHLRAELHHVTEMTRGTGTARQESARRFGSPGREVFYSTEMDKWNKK